MDGERPWDNLDSGLVTILSLRKGLRSAMRAEVKIILSEPVGTCIASNSKEVGQLVDDTHVALKEFETVLKNTQ